MLDTEQMLVAGKASLGRKWSSGLVAETRATLDYPEHFRHGYVHMKNCGGMYGLISGYDILARRFHIRDKDTQFIAKFSTIDAVLSAGWVVD